MKTSCRVFLLSAILCALSPIDLLAQTPTINPYVQKSLPSVAINNLLKAERVFCYTVSAAPQNYQGYTIDQMAVTGFCGVLEKEEADLFYEEFFTKPENLSQQTAQCTISPKIMLRFIRGIDSTDVLFSNPCPSLTVFYGGTIKSFNAAPSAEAISGVIALFEENRADFVSPTLLNQLLPIGVALTDEQKNIVKKQNEVQPIRNWNTSSQPSQSNNSPEKEPKKGWGKVSLDKKN